MYFFVIGREIVEYILHLCRTIPLTTLINAYLNAGPTVLTGLTHKIART